MACICSVLVQMREFTRVDYFREDVYSCSPETDARFQAAAAGSPGRLEEPAFK